MSAFKHGDRVRIQVGVDTYLEGTFTRYHEEDPNMVWTKVEGYPDPYMELGWNINRVSQAEREVSPEEAVRRFVDGDERLKLDDPIDNPAYVRKETIDHPDHYNTGKIEVIDFIEDWNMGFHLGNVVKYVARAEHKGKALEDLKKARWYLNREIERRENETS